ncbi:MAG TPA: 2-oxoglutarate and iron-dependent oxygenase domain-containing protein [Acidimicrobiia bacterium]|nr:2-oxoglutarate and iron-dependent oxygenase domain-containing protein [Acidimicrobiia bacterium]
MKSIPVIDVSALVAGAGNMAAVDADIDRACREVGFFSIVGHGVSSKLCHDLLTSARAFFALDDAEKSDIEMARGGRAWRGWFPVGGELTSGIPDRKEGIYFGAEMPTGTARPLRGPNLFPARPTKLRVLVLEYIDEMTRLGHALMRAIARGLGRDADEFQRALTADPTILFRIFHYPPSSPAAAADDEWGVREHTDYGLLTMLLQDDSGGLQVHGRAGWVDIPPQPDAFVCNLGDMLERITEGRYRSTPHRVRNASTRGRLSCPFFFDPSWDAQVGDTTYGNYLLAKVARVFPELGSEVL